jgi:hypothetical protein
MLKIFLHIYDCVTYVEFKSILFLLFYLFIIYLHSSLLPLHLLHRLCVAADPQITPQSILVAVIMDTLLVGYQPLALLWYSQSFLQRYCLLLIS